MAEKIEPLIEINVRSKGIEAVTRDLDKLVSSEEELVVATERSSKVRERSEASIDRIAKKYDQEYRIAQQLAKEMSILERARNAGLGGTEAFERALGAVIEMQKKLHGSTDEISKKMGDFHVGTTSMIGRLDSWTASQKRVTDATNDNVKAAGLARHEWVNLGRQAQDAFTMLALGSSPMQVLTSQGAQIADVFSSSQGGAGAALKDFASTVGRGLLNPVTLAAAAFGAAAYATLQWQKQVDALTVSLNGLGRASGLTREGANAVAERAAAASGISGSAARGLAAQYLGAGVGREALGGAIGVTRDFGRKLGLSEDDAAKTLSGALADPARGAEELAKKFGLLSYAQREEIQRTADMAGKATAAAKMVDSLNQSLDKLHDPTLRIVKLYERLKDSTFNFFDRLPAFMQNPGQNARLGASIGRDMAQMPEAERAFVSHRLDEELSKQLGLDKLASDAAFAAREITAETFAEREAIVMEKGRMQALLDTEHATRHLMEAEGERLRMLAEAQRKVEDYTRQADRDIALSKAKTPYERGRMQIIQEGEELLRQIPASITKHISTPRALRSPTAAPEAFSGGTGDLLAEAQRRGLEPTESNFQKLIDEGIGQNKFRGRLIRMDEGFTQSTVDVPNIDRGRLEKQTRNVTASRLANYDEIQQRDFFGKINDDIEKQNKLLDVEAATFGKSTAEIERARKEQELLNQAKQQGIDKLDGMAEGISNEAAKYGDLAQRQEEQRKHQQGIIDSLDEIRGASRDMASGMISDFRQGASGAKILENSLDRILSKILDASMSGAIDNLLGKQGGFDGGILGGLFGMFKGGFFKGPFGFPQWPFADGGVMGPHGPIPLRAYAAGGVATSPQLAMFGEGSRPEAYVPLPDGRTIPVTLQAAQQHASQISAAAQRGPAFTPKVTINNNAPGVTVRPEITRDEMVLYVESRISTNNKKQGEAARRSA